ncbi:MAG TPA: hypothetical protein VG738_05500 [Chitinophagaceae bacterium]|nr:hypothetical protein [Chitinophagaceae bacterium]
MVTNDTYLAQCRQEIEVMLGWGDSAGWTNSDFDNLSDKIEEKTGIRLSISTLKRIWGRVQYNSSPTAATLNTLAKFSGYENWREFQQKHKTAEPGLVYEEVVEIIKQPVVQAPPAAPMRKKSKRTLIKVVCGVMAVIVFSLVALMLPGKKQNQQAAQEAFFESKKTSDDLPNSVVFNYNASAFHSDSVYLQQNWDTTRRQRLPPDGRQVTSIYYYPGYFNSKLIVDGEIKKESPVFIQTKGWKGIIEKKPVPIYLSAEEIKQQGAMGIPAVTLGKKTGSPVFNDTWVDFTNVREFDSTDAADFSFETTVRNTGTVEQSVCRKIKICVLGTRSAIIIPLSDKGCIADINLLTGYQWIYGKEHDLSAFGCDMGRFQHVAFTVKENRLKVFLNGAMVMDVSQPGSIGAVIGIRYNFEGPGEVKEVKLVSRGKTVYADRF